MKVLILCLFLSLSATASDIVFSGRSPRSYEPGQWINIYLLNLETMEREQITKTEYNDHQATLSRDGQWIAFRSDKWKTTMWGPKQIALYDRKTKKVERVGIPRFHWGISPTFSPDSKYLYFGLARAPRKGTAMSTYQITRLDLETRKIEVLTNNTSGTMSDYQVSPDGSKIVYRKNQSQNQILMIFDLVTREHYTIDKFKYVRERASNPRWRDAHRIVYRANFGEKKFNHDKTTFEFDMRTKSRKQIMQFDEIYRFQDSCWITPNKAVISAADQAMGEMRLYIYEKNGGEETLTPIWQADTTGANSDSPDC